MNATRPVQRLLVANRGEIALRIVEACRKLGVEAVVGVSEADRETAVAQRATRAVRIGPAPAARSYLRKEVIVAAALGTQCDALHPGYGFLAERTDFRPLCDEHGITFVGPAADAIEAIGDKRNARRVAQGLGVPTVPGSDPVSGAEDAAAFSHRAGYPFLLKASARGGRRGMRVVRPPKEVRPAFDGAHAEATAAFGDATLYIERYIERARHVEIQVVGDGHGSVVHLGERDCSIRRRHQKLIEQAPPPAADAALRAQMASAAVAFARHVAYVGAGTVEFVIDLDSRALCFLEMSTRIQVEHPITEMTTGVDLVAAKIRVAGGAPLSMPQDEIRAQGHAIECRINAEMPTHDFRSNPGRPRRWRPALRAGVRVDSRCSECCRIPPFYDSMIAKLIVHAADRESAILKVRAALRDFEIEGVHTTIPFHAAVLSHPDFVRSRTATRWVEEAFMKSAWQTAAA